MSQIRSKDTSIEIRVRSYLFSKGYRYKKYVRELPGCPDIVLTKYRAAVFVNGCFWHRHGCRRTFTPQTRQDYWQKRFDQNVKNDAKHYADLKEMGWTPIIVWECEIKSDFLGTMERVMNELQDSIKPQKN